MSLVDSLYSGLCYIPLASLVVGAFNPFTFRVIIGIYVPIAIFSMVFGLVL